MNTLFGDMAKRVEAFDPYEEAIIATKEAEAEIIDFNVEDQLYERGIDSRGKSLGEYANFTKEKKEQEGKPFDRVTLRDEGDFHRSFNVKFGVDRFQIEASDSKTEDLQQDWGDEILGLTDQNLDHIKNDFIRPNMQKAFRAKILI